MNKVESDVLDMVTKYYNKRKINKILIGIVLTVYISLSLNLKTYAKVSSTISFEPKTYQDTINVSTGGNDGINVTGYINPSTVIVTTKITDAGGQCYTYLKCASISNPGKTKKFDVFGNEKSICPQGNKEEQQKKINNFKTQLTKGAWQCTVVMKNSVKTSDGDSKTIIISDDKVNKTEEKDDKNNKEECQFFDKNNNKRYLTGGYCGAEFIVEKCCSNGKCYGTINGKSTIVSKSIIKSDPTIAKNESSSICSTKDKEPTNVTTTYKVTFDQYKGNGLVCENGTSNPTCTKNVKKGSTTNFPSSSNMVRNESGYGSLIGWDNGALQANGEPACLGGDSVTNSTLNKTNQTGAIYANTTYRACYREVINATKYLVSGSQADGGSEIKCGESIEIDYCTLENGNNYCYGKVSGEARKVYRNKIKSDFKIAEADCNNETVEDKIEENEKYKETEFDKMKSCSNSVKKNISGTRTYKNFCYQEEDSLEDIYHKLSGLECDSRGNCEVNPRKVIWVCASGSQIVENSIINKDEVKKCNKNGICINSFEITCAGNNDKPSISVTSGIAQSNGYGTITVKATSKVGKIDSYYSSDYYLQPTNNTSGWESVNGNTFTITSTPGTKYIWVRDTKGNISNAVSGAVIDTTNTKTTLAKLELEDANGQLQTPSRISYNIYGIKSDKYVKLSNDLSKDSKIIADGFNPFDTEYKIEVSSPTITVYATLTSTDSSYVPGYEPRTVNLNYGINTILIKIQDNEGKIRTYTILVTRTDIRTNDNTLSDIKVSSGEINFNSNVTEYKIEIPSTTTQIKVESKIANDKASYVPGYEPGYVSITKDVTVKLIKVKSETGSTRTYLLTFIKQGKDQVKEESLQLSHLVIPNVYVPFEKEVLNYSIFVGYETDLIDINTVLNDENSKAIISIKKNGEQNYKLSSNTGISLGVGENYIEIEVRNAEGKIATYRLTIIRKEFGLEISNDKTLKDLRVLGYEIDFNPNEKEYVVKIKQEKSLVITAVPNNNRAEVFIRGNDELTGFSTVRIKVVAENGEYETYSIDIKKDAYNKTIEIASILAGVVIILISSGIIVLKKKNKAKKEYFEE